MGKSWIFDVYDWVFESLQHKNNSGGYSSIGRATVCGTESSLFKSEYPP
jgi:hypothetical protein